VKFCDERRARREQLNNMADRFRAGKRLWSKADDARVRRLYPDTSTQTLVRRLRRTVPAIFARARLLGIKKSVAFRASEASARIRRGDHRGRTCWFPKGHDTWNKGLRRPGWHSGRMRDTQFKKGGRPHTWVPIGTEVVDPDGYVKWKINDDRAIPSRFNWQFLHVLVWEYVHGPVPPGHTVVFKNKDKHDCRPTNLELITRRELMRRNSIHNLPAPLMKAIQLLGALNRQIRKRDRHAEEQHQRSA
jgi:hypothetical protein